ncbi:hypothetical protein L6164_020697 [Bauhinia variegata]|uniref:Uncharacterized protein n=1 Tax=Bauhinia variegata TaxID=167791 RepID=A0ACB9MX78_BAUVA|nr:hypothetical protein L6164_020697 [Bauhinia variegata]
MVDPSHVRHQKGPFEEAFREHEERFGSERVHPWREAMKKVGGVVGLVFQDREEAILIERLVRRVLKELSNTPRDYAIDVLRSFGFRGEIAITVLTEKCLIKITPENTLAMHDQIRDMGRQIVLEENLVDPAMRSRLWNRSEIMAVLKHDTGTRCIQGIVLDFERKIHVEDIEKDKEVLLPTRSFEQMVNLRMLQINNLRMEGNFKFLPAQLKCLQWQKCPLERMPSDFYPRELAILDLSYSHQIKNLWGWKSYKVPENLLVMNLSYCVNLAAVPDLSACQHLEKIDLEGCTSIVKIHESIGNLIKLRHLNLSDCSNLIELPSDIYGLKHLENLFLSRCSKLEALPKNIGCMISLRRLLLDDTAIAELPESIFHLTKLEKLILDGCINLRRLPHCIGHLCSLQELSLNRSALEELPDSIGCLANLEKLSLVRCGSLTSIPEAIGNLISLTELRVDRSAITEVPSSIGQLSYLGELSVENCKSLSKLPCSIGALASIVVLQLNGTTITNLPDQIGAMKTLRKLDMRDCIHLKSLPESIGSLLGLTSLNLLNSNIRELPESIGLLENLVTLKLNKSRMLRKLPASIGNLKSLCRFLMEETAVTELPESFGMLSSLMILKMAKKPAEDEVSSSKENLNSFVLSSSFCNLTLLNYFDASSWRISGKIPDDFEKLSSLETLLLGGNKFQSLPSSLKGLYILKKLVLRNCSELTSLPSLPSSLIELDAQNCTALKSISDLSNLENLQMLNLTNCAKVEDIPGLESFKSLKGLDMSGCSACTFRVTKRLSKVSLRKLLNLSMPGSRIPEWFSGQTVSFSKHKSRELKGVIIGCIVSINHSIPCEARNHLPAVVDVQVSVLKMGKSIYNGSLRLHGVPRTNEEHIHLCRYLDRDPLFLYLRDGDTVRVSKRNPPVDNGLELRKCGVHLIYEGEDDYEGDEESVDVSLQSVSEKLVKFFNTGEEQKSPHSTNNSSFLFLSGIVFGIIAITAILCRAKG